jgi:hypothetical protein
MLAEAPIPSCAIHAALRENNGAAKMTMNCQYPLKYITAHHSELKNEVQLTHLEALDVDKTTPHNLWASERPF